MSLENNYTREYKRAFEVGDNEVHETSCENCPSEQGTDPEVEDIFTWPKEERLKTLFRCAWRPERLCKGYWKKMQ